MKRLLILLLAALLLTGCSSIIVRKQGGPAPPAETVILAEIDITFVEVDEAEWPPEIRDWVEARTQGRREQWSGSMDFGNATWILLYAGEQPSGGYAVKVDRVSRADEKVWVDARVLAPVGGADDVLTYPMAVLRIPRYGKPIWFSFHPPSTSQAGKVVRTEVRLGETTINPGVMQTLQAVVDSGDHLWRLDPEQVARQEGKQYGLDQVKGARIRLTEQGPTRAVVEAEIDGELYHIILIQPAKAGPTGIWTISEIDAQP